MTARKLNPNHPQKAVSGNPPDHSRKGRRLKPEVSRRDFLSLAWKGILSLMAVLGLGGTLRFLSFQSGPQSPDHFDLGPASEYPPGSRTPIPQAQAVLIHASEGFTALSMVCPHLGCQVNSQDDGYACPCHGSRFDQAGRLLRGPAARPLTRLTVELDQDGRLILHSRPAA